MAEETNRRREFPAFPFDPYPIQIDFMNALYDALDKGGVAMLESPTGTGKTLSIICSALQWLVDQRRKPSKSGADGGGDGGGGEDEPDWLRDFVVEPEERRPRGLKKERKNVGFGFGFGSADKKAPAPSGGTCNRNLRKDEGERGGDAASEADEGSEFLLDEYESEEEGAGYRTGKAKRRSEGSTGWSSSSDEEESREEMEEEAVPKVFFCSRTHSQLSQFVKEFKRTTFASEISLVCLGSRKNLCINPEVLKLRNSNWINERCLELQKNKTRKDPKIKVQNNDGRNRANKSSCGCPMLRKSSLQKLFKEEGWHEAMDMEDLVQLGRNMGTCPYYGSRSMIPAADLVVLPYQSLLLESARESLALNLKNSIVIIDEAHNLADSTTSMYNSKINLSQLKEVYSHLELYLHKFQSRLGAGNRRYIQILMVLTRSFIRILLDDKNDSGSIEGCNAEKLSEEKSATIRSMTINELLFALDIDNINFVKLYRYIKDSKIIHKVSGFGTKMVDLGGGPVHMDDQNYAVEGTAVSGFQALANILISLTNTNQDGRIIVSRQQSTCTGQLEEGYIKFVMLSGEKIFSEILDEAHAIVLAGGTLQPTEETRMRLFPGLSSSQMHFFSCNHIVPPESILPIVICRGPSDTTFDFSYGSRNTPGMILELGRLVCNLVTVVPEGLVVFFSSFEYESQVYDSWKASGILDRILKKKHVFREPKSNIDVERILKEYKEAISCYSKVLNNDLGPQGALLMAVVGGKVSEGINFSDGMGRCIIMVGLPYPSPSDIELMERITHIEGLGASISPFLNKPLDNTIYANNTIQSGFNLLRSCSQRGKDYYENLCMKAVNQSIGRAIRHIYDYAAILLVDTRYASNLSKSFSNPSDKLPVWIRDRLIFANGSYGQVHRQLHQFFQFNKLKRCS